MKNLETGSTSQPIFSGIITGQIAGLLMAIVVMLVFTIFLGKHPFFPVQVIGSVLLGENVLHGFSLPGLLAGLLLHQLGPSLLWGLIYGLIAKKIKIQNTKQALSVGLILAGVSMIGPYFLIPAAFHLLQGVDYWNREVPIAWDWAAHLVFGASFFLYPKVAKSFFHSESK